MVRIIPPNKGGKTIRVVLADDAGLLYSDDYRMGWRDGFDGIGCDVKVVNIRPLAGLARVGHSVTSMRSPMPKSIGKHIAALGADIVFFHHGRNGANPAFQQEIKKSGAKTAVYLCDEPYETGQTAYYSQRYDYVFTMDPCTAEVHRMSRPDRKNVFYLPPGANGRFFKYSPYYRDGALVRELKAFFLGNASLIPRPQWLKPVEAIEGADIRFWKAVWKKHPEWVPAEKHPEFYAKCLVGLNVHRAPWMSKECYHNRVINRRSLPAKPPPGLQIHTAPPPQGWGTGFWNEGNLPAAHWNPRFIEMAACGTLVVSDNHRTEMAREFPFAPQAESPEHFLELVEFYMAHPKKAEEIGQACSIRISKRHTYLHRAAEVLVRMGFGESLPEETASSLGEQQDWLTPQDTKRLSEKSFLGQTGLSERWSHRHGSSLIGTSGSESVTNSIRPRRPWLL